ncbi:hypothetical protein ABAC402_18460 [Asticcacaulis sp. AC402]|nr:hypothetical protein ABAC402_18460 [Asticcacaulis sp. AC402]
MAIVSSVQLETRFVLEPDHKDIGAVESAKEP